MVLVDAGASGKSLSERPSLPEALSLIHNGDANVLVVAKLDRLSRSLLDFAGLLADAQARGWVLVALDLGIDLSTPAGEFMGLSALERGRLVMRVVHAAWVTAMWSMMRCW